jgi:hypothetical protein
VTINYSSKNSLSRINVTQEIEWFDLLENLNQDWSQNFLIESARNFLRIGDRASARVLLDQIDPKRRSLQEKILKLLAQ